MRSCLVSRRERMPAFSPRCIVACGFILFATIASAGAVHTSLRRLPLVSAMPWMCLERCGYTETEIVDQVEQLEAQADVINAVSYEWGDLGPNGTFVFNNFTRVSNLVAPFAVSVAMLTTANLSYVRQLFAPDIANDFVKQVVEAATREGNIDGVNFDFEPSDSAVTNADAIGFAAFLKIARVGLWEMGGMFVSVDIAEWSSVWNWTLINDALVAPLPETAVPSGYVMTMSTYTTNNELFINRLNAAQANISAHALVVGMDVWHSNPAAMNDTAVAWRFGALAARGVCRVAIWQTPIPDTWVQQLRSLSRLCSPKLQHTLL